MFKSVRRHFPLSHHGMLGPSITNRRLLQPRQDVKVERKNPIFLDNLSHIIRFSIFNRASALQRKDLFCSRTTISDYISFKDSFNLSCKALCLVVMKRLVPLCKHFIFLTLFERNPNLTIPLELQLSYVIFPCTEC